MTSEGLDVVEARNVDAVASVADRETIKALFREHRFDAGVHAGALHKPDIERFSQQDFVDVNVSGTLHLLEQAAARSDTRFVFTSTTSPTYESPSAAFVRAALDQTHFPKALTGK